MRNTRKGGKQNGSNVRKITQFFENIKKQGEEEPRTIAKVTQPYKLAGDIWRGEVISGCSGGVGAEVPERILGRRRDELTDHGSWRGGNS